MKLFSHHFALLLPTILLGACLACAGSPINEQQRPIQQIVPLVDERERFVLPFADSSWADRFLEIRRNRDGYQYGPPLLGNTSFFPTGILGEARVRHDKQLWFRDVQYITENVNKELPLAGQALATSGGLKSLSSFTAMYEQQWKGTIPDGVSPGMLTNWTQDLLFSMERLSINPYVVRRLHPDHDGLPYAVERAAVEKLTGQTMDQLHGSGRLFFANHTIQKKYPINRDRWTAACSAYFFIHPISGDFLPLAIRTHVGSDLIFTPLDDTNDWLLAKMAFEMNDLFHGQIYHLSNTHDVAEPVHQAALRTFSRRHPVRGYLDRLMYQAYAVRPIGDEFLFNDGGFFDSSFAPTNFGGRTLSSDLYVASAGLFRSSTFDSDLIARGLVNCTYGPPLKTVPFYDTVRPMTLAIRRFTEAYVRTYYPSDTDLVRDYELQEWVLETIDGAQVLDFPPFPMGTRDTLVSILSHIAFLTGIGHHVLNGATPGESSGVLPLHPSAFSKPLPTRKGSVDSLMPYLHNETEALKQASLLVRFNRPLVEEQKANLVNMWSGTDFLAHTCSAVISAAEDFQKTMLDISDDIRARAFDDDGLAQGMPFVWRSLDPRRIPYYLSV